MKKKRIGILLAGAILSAVSGCGNQEPHTETETAARAIAAETSLAPEESQTISEDTKASAAETEAMPETSETSDAVTEGTEEYRGFSLDNVLHSENDGDIHFNLYVPDSYDGSEPYALFFTLPGYEGLYFQGVGENLYSETFGFEAQNYIPDMIIVAPQLSDWGETSANQTIALVEYFLENYNIDESRVFAEGYSGGGQKGNDKAAG